MSQVTTVQLGLGLEEPCSCKRLNAWIVVVRYGWSTPSQVAGRWRPSELIAGYLHIDLTTGRLGLTSTMFGVKAQGEMRQQTLLWSPCYPRRCINHTLRLFCNVRCRLQSKSQRRVGSFELGPHVSLVANAWLLLVPVLDPYIHFRRFEGSKIR